MKTFYQYLEGMEIDPGTIEQLEMTAEGNEFLTNVIHIIECTDMNETKGVIDKLLMTIIELTKKNNELQGSQKTG